MKVSAFGNKGGNWSFNALAKERATSVESGHWLKVAWT